MPKTASPLVLEEYLKKERVRAEAADAKELGARTAYHLMAALSMSENQLFEAAFGNPRIQPMRKVVDGESVGVIFRWKMPGDKEPIEH